MPIKNFTPCSDFLNKEYGLVTSAIYGFIWRFSNEGKGYCTAAHETIGEYLGMDRTTVHRHIRLLIDEKYIKDYTPKLKNKPHKYKPTTKAGFIMTMEAYHAGVAESDTGVAENNMTKVNTKEKNINTMTREQYQELRTLFTKGANISMPNWDTPAGVSMNKYWNKTFKKMYELANYDFNLTRRGLMAAIAHSKNMSWVIQSPQSLYNQFPKRISEITAKPAIPNASDIKMPGE